MRNLLILLGFLSLGFMVNAQQELLMSQQFYSRINKNPAGIGNIEDIDLFALGHFQYAGMEDAPNTVLLNAHTFVDKWNSGFGLSFSYDNLGIARSFTNVKLDYSYGLRFNDDMLLSLGLGFGVLVSTFDIDKYTVDNSAELSEDFIPADTKKCSPDMDLGIEFTMKENLLLGVSVTHLISGETTTFAPGQHLYVYGRYLFKINDKWDIAPMLTYVHHKKVNLLEVNLTGFYNRFVWGGLTWHPDMSSGFKNNPLAITIGAEFKRFRLGYTFDIGIGKIHNIASTSHEVMLSYSIERKKTKTTPSDGDFFE